MLTHSIDELPGYQEALRRSQERLHAAQASALLRSWWGNEPDELRASVARLLRRMDAACRERYAPVEWACRRRVEPERIGEPPGTVEGGVMLYLCARCAVA